MNLVNLCTSIPCTATNPTSKVKAPSIQRQDNMTPGTPVDQQPNPLLLKLSPELRNIIYECVLTATQPIGISNDQQPALTRTCHGIRNECLAMYYALNTFGFCTTSNEVTALDRIALWMQSIGPRHCTNLQCLEIYIGVDNGLMILDPREATDPWTKLVKQMKDLGCSPALDIDVHLKEEEQARDEFMQVIAYLHEEAEQNDDRGRLERCNLTFFTNTLRRAMNIYLSALAVKYLDQPATAIDRLVSNGWDFITYQRHSIFMFERDIFAGRSVPKPPLDEEDTYGRVQEMYDLVTQVSDPHRSCK